MPIRGHVGRHAKTTGRHCQNWKKDQLTVIALLNRIPVDNMGAGGSLKGRVVAGLASRELYQAILRFQKFHFPNDQTGHIEPGGKMLAWLETLANTAAPPPPPPRPAGPPRPPTSIWDVHTRSVQRALNEGLEDDKRLSHADVVNIIRSTLSDGMISPEETTDLMTLESTSKSMLPRSRKMLSIFATELRWMPAHRGPYFLSSPQQQYAADIACDFLSRTGPSRFPNLDRDEIGIGLLMRIANPGLVNQDAADVCGPAALLYSAAADNPGVYTRFVIDLYEKGKAKIEKLEVEPGESLRKYAPPASIDHVDWMAAASLRDSEYFLEDYVSISDKDGGTTATELATWFTKAGYSDVRKKVTKSPCKEATIDEVNQLHARGYRIVLFIAADMLRWWTQSDKSKALNHAIIQRSPIARSNGTVSLTVFTWGDGEYQVPHMGALPLPLADFLANFYGYVAAKP